MKVPIHHIIVPSRIRKELGSLQSLIRSIETHGLLHPLIVDQHMHLISGFRRLSALQQLGYVTVEVQMVSIEKESQALDIEIEENTQRKAFTSEEVRAAHKKMEYLIRKELPWWKRFLRFIRSIFSSHKR